MTEDEWQLANSVVQELLRLKADQRLHRQAVRGACRKVNRSRETIYRWMRLGGPPALTRQRFEMSDAQKIEVMASGGVVRRAFRRLSEAGEIDCSLRTFEKACERDMSAREKQYAKYGPRKGREKGVRLIRTEVGRGWCFEGDHKQAEVWIKTPDKKRLVRPWVTMFIDTWSRAIAGVAVSTRPNQSVILKTMEVSFGDQPLEPRPKANDDDRPDEEENRFDDNVLAGLGSAFDYWPNISPVNCIPHKLRLDRGLDFMANAIADSCIDLDIEIEHTEPYTPSQKGKIERAFRSLKDMLFSTMPYYTKGPKKKNGQLDVPKRVEPLSYVVFVQQVLEWVRQYNFEFVHREIGVTPTVRWNRGEMPLRVPDPADLRRFLLKDFKDKKLESRGVMMHRRYYVCAEADSELDRKVEVRGMPHDQRKYELYSLRTGKWIGTAWDQIDAPDEIREHVKTVERQERRKAEAIYRKGREVEEARWEASVAAETPDQINSVPRPEYERIRDEYEESELDLIGGKEIRDQKWEEE